ncbi:hypothetical protein NE237_017297 [Protea cynaroides]|uniref:ENTH domain-containing protein n=1 Tax=Protea cynaroides TaxID=273540 RepID=A0A9Q0K7R6_9MAGN|nr:hypothetical protein NE237_017297 [Protea cynaroides]
MVVQTKLRLVLGTIKDYASIGKAMICRRGGGGGGGSSHDAGFSGIEIAVVRATGHNSTPIDDKHMHEILFLVSNAPGSVLFLAEMISHRLDKTHDRNVALKTLMLVHRLLRGGNRYFEQNLRNAHLSGHLQIMINKCWGCRRRFHSAAAAGASSCSKKNDYNNYNHSSPPKYSINSNINNSLSSSSSSSSSSDDEDPSASFLLNYAAFLEERMAWVINQAGKLEPIMFQVMEYRSYEDNSTETVFRRLPKYQAFLQRVLDCFPLPLLRINPSDRLTRAAMTNILKESFQVYRSFCEGVATLVDSFFDFKNPARVWALDLLKRASLLSYELSDFFDICKGILGNKNLDYPSVQIVTSDHVLAMEPFLSSSPPSTSSSLATNESCSLSTKTSACLSPFCDYFTDPLESTKTRVTDTITRGKIGEEEGEAAKHTSSINGGTTASSSSSSSSSTPFSCRLETKISKVWVVFDDEESSQDSHFSVGFGGRNDRCSSSTLAEDHSLPTKQRLEDYAWIR